MKFPAVSEVYSLFLKYPQVTTDTRKAAPGNIFFALKGENYNANRFAHAALEQGCPYAVIDEEQHYKGEKYILVKNVLSFLQELAKHHRRQLKIPVIGITGSNGKTTTKELIKAVLNRRFRTLATEGNLNNHIGVPLTLLSIGRDTEIAVIEMGANHIGEIAMLSEIAQPGYGLITNIGKAHIGEFGSFEGIVKAKTELYEYVKRSGGKLFVNGENEMLMKLSTGTERITYGTSGENFSAVHLAGANPCLMVRYEGLEIASHLVGKYNFENAAAAICIGRHFGVEAQQIKEAIESYMPSNNRSQAVMTGKGNTLVLDAYNANPSSMQAAIQNFLEMEGENKWLVLGDMLELGNYEIPEHKNILEQIRASKFSNVVLVGERFSRAVSESGAAFPNLFLFRDSEELCGKLRSGSPVPASSLVLIKGSRGIMLEKAVEFL